MRREAWERSRHTGRQGPAGHEKCVSRASLHQVCRGDRIRPQRSWNTRATDPSDALGCLKQKGKEIGNNTLPAFSSEIAAKICCLDPSVLIPSSFRSPSVSVRKASISTWAERGGFAASCSLPPLFSPNHNRTIVIMSY